MSFWEAFGNGTLFGVALLCVIGVCGIVGAMLWALWEDSKRGFAIVIGILIFLILCGGLGVLVQHLMDS